LPTINISVTGFDPSGLPVNSSGHTSRTIDVIPNECPICHVIITPSQVAQSFANENWIESYFRCANKTCQRAFIALYVGTGAADQRGFPLRYELKAALPITPQEPTFPPEIEALSPSFVKIFTQAQAAEDNGLDEVAGPGFRKALEFLIKDYAISLVSTPEAVEEIKRLMLQPVIKKYLNGDKLPVVSTRAAWLGNDQVHYERRWIGKNLTDLKNLISASIHFISMEKLVEKLPIDMPDPKRAADNQTQVVGPGSEINQDS